jgi:hypothetical protein
MGGIDDLSGDRIKAQLEIFQAFDELMEVVKPALEAPATAEIDTLGRTMEMLAHPARYDENLDASELEFELLRTFELHGEGLRPFSPDAPAQKSDVLIASDRSLWVVTAVDPEGRIIETTGAPRSGGKREIVYSWRPSTAPRQWLHPGQSAAPAYRGLEEAMVHLVRLWGEQWREGRDFSQPAGLFLEILEAPGLKLRAGDLGEYAENAEIAEFCERRGGLRPFASGSSPAAGDVVRLADRKLWGLVTRTTPDGAGAIDLLVCGLPRKGPLGEAREVVQIIRDYAPSSLDRFWRPSAVTGQVPKHP